MNDLTHLDLFSGIGGFALAAGWAGFRTIQFVEIDAYCRSILKKYWPKVPTHDDIRTFKWALADSAGSRRSRRGLSAGQGQEREGTPDIIGGGQVTLLTGGFPCQPFSVSGNRRGAADDRFLWPEMLRAISEVRPAWIIAENVPGIKSMEFAQSLSGLATQGDDEEGGLAKYTVVLDEICSQIERIGYEVQPIIIPACAVDAPHQRARVWIVGHAERGGRHRIDRGGAGPKSQARRSELSNPKVAGLEVRKRKGRKEMGFIRVCRWPTEPDVGRVAYGIPARVDRIKALGNAIVPQVAYQIIKGIAEIEQSPRVDTLDIRGLTAPNRE